MTSRATVFGEVAETYDRLRPAYPKAMYDDLIAEAGLSSGSAVLEIGCGTGLATVELVRRGLEVVAVDPDRRMLVVAKDRIDGRHVRFIEARFEDSDGAGRSFEIVLAAGSWHWVDPDIGIPLAATLLQDRGRLAACWNLPRPEDTSRPAGIEVLYGAIAPELADVASQVKNRNQEHRRRAVVASGYFGEPAEFSYRWTRSVSTTEYCGLLSTHSDHRMLGPERLGTLLTAIAELVDRDGGTLELAYETILYVFPKQG